MGDLLCDIAEGYLRDGELQSAVPAVSPNPNPNPNSSPNPNPNPSPNSSPSPDLDRARLKGAACTLRYSSKAAAVLSAPWVALNAASGTGSLNLATSCTTNRS